MSKEIKDYKILKIMLLLLIILVATASFILKISITEVYAAPNAASSNKGIELQSGGLREEAQEKESIPATSLDEPESLLTDYINVITEKYAQEQASLSYEAKNSVVPGKLRGDRLTGAERIAYDVLKEKITSVAKGENEDGSTSFKVLFSEIYTEDVFNKRFTAKELSVDAIVEDGSITQAAADAVLDQYTLDTEKVVTALLYDCPYELFWFDKTGLDILKNAKVGAEHNGSEWKAYCSATDDSCYTFYFAVSKDFTPSTFYVYTFKDENNNAVEKPIQTDTEKIKSVNSAVERAVKLAASHPENSSDYSKLSKYKDWICNEVAYNHSAAEDATTPYGNPWQLIYVFDNDPDTNVVCEGYSKAFKYLCDLTSFDDSSISCNLATGEMGGGTGAGNHMWNILHMDDGKNYIADITNCDKDSVGNPDKLFLKGATSKIESGGYKYICAGDKSSNEITYEYDADTKSLYSDTELEMSLDDYKVTSTSDTTECAGEHSWDSGVRTEPTYEEDGKIVYTCTLCGKTKEEKTEDSLKTQAAAAMADAEAAKEVADEAAKTPGEAAVEAAKVAEEAAKKAAEAAKTAADAASNDDSLSVEEKNDARVVASDAAEAYEAAKAATQKASEDKATAEEEAKKKAEEEAARKRAEANREIVDLPAVKISKPKAAKKKITVKWKKVSKKNLKRIGGIEIQVTGPYGYNKTYTAGAKKTSKAIKKLASKQKYRVRVRAYKWIGGKKHVSRWSGWKSVKVK